MRLWPRGPRDFALFAGSAYDPTASAGLVAWQRPDNRALILRGGTTATLPGSHPALGGARIAWREEDELVIADAGTLAPAVRVAAPGAGVLGLSDQVLAWRTRDAAGTDRLLASAGDAPVVLFESPAPREIGRPAVIGTTILCHTAGPDGSRVLAIDATTGVQQVLRSDPLAQITNPATDGARLLYVHATGEVQTLRVGPIAPSDPDDDAVVLVHPAQGRRDKEHEPGRRLHRQGYAGHRHPPLPPRATAGVVATLWSTALTPATAYVTRLQATQGAPRTADVLSVPAPA
jgi:hypothetical protein